ncbi:MAG: hypothetical protein MUO62_06560, partial [Anaerolineales bacterium]|nr:hypothetical protein [Anaerolineales bacterium]
RLAFGTSPANRGATHPTEEHSVGVVEITIWAKHSLIINARTVFNQEHGSKNLNPTLMSSYRFLV